MGEHQQAGLCRQEVLQRARVRKQLEGGHAAGLQLLHKVCSSYVSGYHASVSHTLKTYIQQSVKIKFSYEVLFDRIIP